MILHNASDQLSSSLLTNFSNTINWSNKRLNVLSAIVTQKMGLFRYRSMPHGQHSEYNRHYSAHGTSIRVCSFQKPFDRYDVFIYFFFKFLSFIFFIFGSFR